MEVKKVCRKEVPHLADVLLRAFREDPFYLWMLKGDPDYEEKLLRKFNRDLDKAVSAGTVYTTFDCRGVALWDAPTESPLHENPLHEIKDPNPLVDLIGERADEVLDGFRTLEALRPECEHWYLSIFATDPVHQRTGVGTAIIRPVLDRCDRDGAVAYLETSRERNTVYYSRFGFERTGHVRIDNGPELWTMQRDPKPI